MEMQAMIIDDEELAIQTLTRLLGGYDNVKIVGTFTDPLKGLVEVLSHKPTVLFLDIEMPVLNGFDVAKQISQSGCGTKVVFVTAYDEYALQAFEVNSLDYLLKPVMSSRLKNTMDKLSSSANVSAPENAIEAAIKATKTKLNRILVHDDDHMAIVNPLDILFFSAEGNYVNIVTEKKSYVTKETLKYWEERMTEFDFFRCHKSFLVNLHKIEEIHPMFNSTYDISIANYPEKISVSRRYVAELKKLIGM